MKGEFFQTKVSKYADDSHSKWKIRLPLVTSDSFVTFEVKQCHTSKTWYEDVKPKRIYHHASLGSSLLVFRNFST